MQRGRILAFCNGAMFLRSNKRIKDGKEHRYYTVVESRRLGSGKVAQRQVLYLGEINDSQQAAWRKTLDVFDEQQCRYTPLSLFPEDRPVPADAIDSVQVKLSEMKLDDQIWGAVAEFRRSAEAGNQASRAALREKAAVEAAAVSTAPGSSAVSASPARAAAATRS